MSDKIKKKKSPSDIQRELRDLSKPREGSIPAPPIDVKKASVRVGLILAVIWVGGAAAGSAIHSSIPLMAVGGLTLIVMGIAFWAVRYVKKTQAIGALLQGAETAEGRKDALEKLESGFKRGDTQALIARAQLEMQSNPEKALSILESIDLKKQMTPVADQVRSMRAMMHLTQGQVSEARALVDVIDLGKAQEPKSRAMFAAVAGEAWGRTGQSKKAVETLELFNPDDPDFDEIRIQLWRARAFAFAGVGDLKGLGRALRKLVDLNPQLLGMFIGQKKIHPLIEREAKQLISKSGMVQRKMIRAR